MFSASEAHATHLCEALSRVGLRLNQSECVEVLSKLAPDSASNSQNSDFSDDLRRAEQFVDEMLEGMFEPNYKLFMQRFEEKYHILEPEVDFEKHMREERELVGAYFGREFLGTVAGTKRVGDDRYPNLVRYIWRCFFEKNETLLRLGIYEKDGTHYVSGMNFI